MKHNFITPAEIHNYYLQATKELNPKNYNPKAQKPYSQLNKEQRFIDKFITDKINQKISDKLDLDLFKNDMPKTIRTFQNICVLCHQHIAVLCGTPTVSFAGCCVSVEWGKTSYIIPLKAHIWCFQKQKKRTSLKFEKKEVKEIVKKANKKGKRK